MSERRAELLDDPDVARAMAMMSGAREEALKIVPGGCEAEIRRRNQIELKILQDLTERNSVIAENGKFKTNTEVPREPAPTL